MRGAEWLVNFLAVYATGGLLFALACVTWGLGRLDAAAQGASFGVRLLLLPGVAALWPWLAWRWWQNWRAGVCEPPLERNAHRQASARRSA